MLPLTIETTLIQLVTPEGRLEQSCVFANGLAYLVLPQRVTGLVVGRTYRLTLAEVSMPDKTEGG